MSGGNLLVEVGKTPLVEVEGVYAKMECTNPLGSIKDRIASYIIDESERRGLLKPGMEIVEASSGNTGIAFASFARERGYPITIVMPENMSEERKRILLALGAKMASERYGTTVTVFPDGLSKYKSHGLSRTAEGPCRYHKQCSCPIQDVCPRHSPECDADPDCDTDPEC